MATTLYSDTLYHNFMFCVLLINYCNFSIVLLILTSTISHQNIYILVCKFNYYLQRKYGFSVGALCVVVSKDIVCYDITPYLLYAFKSYVPSMSDYCQKSKSHNINVNSGLVISGLRVLWRYKFSLKCCSCAGLIVKSVAICYKHLRRY